MNSFLIYAFLFWLGCLLGWIIELLFRRFVSNRKLKIWTNPGFLEGPYLPLYGFGLCTLYALAQLEYLIPSQLLLFTVMAICMTLLEYIAGLIFIKGLHVKLWDYSKLKFNIQGIICPLFSFFWACLGAIYYFIVHPHILNALLWFSDNLAFSFIIGMFFGVFGIDVVYSLNIVTKVKRFAKDHNVIVRYELLRQEIREHARETKSKIPFFFVLKSPAQVLEHLVRYAELDQAFGDNEPPMS